MQNTSLTGLLKTTGKTMKTGANRHFALNNPAIAWFVLSGYVDVFSTTFDKGEPVGTRSFFFEAAAGEMLFGINPEITGFGLGLLAVPAPGTEIVELDAARLKNLPDDETTGVELAEKLETWIGHLSNAVSKELNPKTDQLLEPGADLHLKAHLKFRAKKGIVWCEIVKGNALFLDMKEVAEPGKPCLFPVSRDSWLQTIGACQVRTFTTAEVFNRGDISQRTDDFYETVFYCDFFNNRLFSVDEYNRLNQKTLNYTQVRTSTLMKMAAVLDQRMQQTTFEAGNDPMLRACSLVAGASGISVKTPKRPKNEDSAPVTLNDVLRASRFRARKVELTGKWWKNEQGPLLAFTKEKLSPVALLPGPGGKNYVADPMANTKILLDENNAAAIDNQAFQFYRPLPGQPVTGFGLIRFGLKNCYRDILMVLLAGLAGGLLNLLVPLVTGIIFDQIIPQSDFRQLYTLIFVVFTGTIALVFFQLVRSFTMIRIETKLDFALQPAIWDRLLNLPLPFFRNFTSGELTSRANSIMVLRKILSDTVIYSVLGAVFMLVNFFLLIYYDALLSAWIFAILLVSFLLILLIGKKIEKHQVRIIRLQNRIYGKLLQVLSSISKIRIAGVEVFAFSQWADHFTESKINTLEVRKLSLNIVLLMNTLPVVVTIVLFGAISVQLPNSLTTGGFMAFYSALMLIVASFLQLAGAAMSWFMASPYLENLKPILQAIPENAAVKPEMGNLTGEIEVSEVCFRYDEGLPLVLNKVSMQVQPGEFVGIVGSSGSGKSTLLRLLLGFDTPVSGAVYYDRQDISTIDPASVRRQTGTVLQQSQLVAGTIFTNIAGMSDTSWDDAWEAARTVGLDEDIKQMPMGMHTVVTGGLSTLSGGQRQRIMIARAIINKPRILFFDEATSALDNKTQLTVSQGLEKLQATRIVIAHRMSTIQHADRIYLLDNGQIAESGTYQQLIAKKGKFYELVNRQMVENATHS